MKKLFRAYPNFSRLVVAGLLLAAALIGSGFIHLPFIPAGLLLVILVNWLMFRTEGKNLNVLCFNYRPRNLLLIPFGLAMGIGLYLLTFYAGTFIFSGQIIRNSNIDGAEVMRRFWKVLPTTAVQDFIVVGYCFYKLIQLTGKRIAVFVVGLFFITMHDFWNGGLVNAFYLSTSVFIGYLLFSTALLRSGSIWLPIGIHWGNNFANSTVFTYNRTPTSWLYIINHSYLQRLSAGQAIGLFVAANIGAAVVIGIICLAWRGRGRIDRSAVA